MVSALRIALAFAAGISMAHAQGWPPDRCSIAYFGDAAAHPGLKVSAPAWRKALGHAANQKTFTVSPALGVYYHWRNHTGAFLEAEATYRTRYTKGFFWEPYLGAGYLRTFLAGKTYEVSDEGVVRRIPFAGNNQFMPSLGFGIGKERDGKALQAWYFRVGGYLQYPHNTLWLPNLNLEVGTTWKLHSK